MTVQSIYLVYVPHAHTSVSFGLTACASKHQYHYCCKSKQLAAIQFKDTGRPIVPVCLNSLAPGCIFSVGGANEVWGVHIQCGGC